MCSGAPEGVKFRAAFHRLALPDALEVSLAVFDHGQRIAASVG